MKVTRQQFEPSTFFLPQLDADLGTKEKKSHLGFAKSPVLLFIITVGQLGVLNCPGCQHSLFSVSVVLSTRLARHASPPIDTSSKFLFPLPLGRPYIPEHPDRTTFIRLTPLFRAFDSQERYVPEQPVLKIRLSLSIQHIQSASQIRLASIQAVFIPQHALDDCTSSTHHGDQNWLGGRLPQHID